MNDEIKMAMESRPVFFRCVDDANDTVMLTDTQGKLFYVNRAWQRVYEYDSNEVIGKTPNLLRTRHQSEQFYKDMWKSILDPTKGYWAGELINRSKTGKEVPVFLTISPFRDEADQVQGYMGIAVDISEKKRLEAQIMHQDRLASIGLIASGLAHEIGTPLGVIRGRAEYLAMLLGDEPNLKGNLEVIITQIDRISKLIYSLLHLARANQSDEVSAVPVREVLEQVLVLMSQKSQKAKIEVINKVPSSMVVRAESARLEQVLLNLIMNAAQAIEAAEKSGRLEGHQIEATAEESKNHWNLFIRDTGCGIPPENLTNIFKPFFTTKDVGVGTGLGLAITDQIIRSWGGSLTVKSEVNKGTTFSINFKKA